MKSLYAAQFVTISELRQNPMKAIRDTKGNPAAIMVHNHVRAYLMPVELFEKMMKTITLMEDELN